MILSEWGRIIGRMDQLLEVDTAGRAMTERTNRDVAR